MLLDLRHITFIPAEGVLALVNVARLWHRRTYTRIVLRNLHLKVQQYLERMDLLTQCAAWIETEIELTPELFWDRSPDSASLLELMPIASDELANPSDVARAVARAKRLLRTWIGQDEMAVNRLSIMLSELASNIVHSGDRGFAIMQHYASRPPVHPGAQVTIAIADLGIGIEASLRQRPRALRAAHLQTGADYILHALELGVTSRETPGGTGLFQVRQWVDEWAGTLVIRSLGSCIEIAASTIKQHHGLAPLPGTQLTLTVRRQTNHETD